MSLITEQRSILIHDITTYHIAPDAPPANVQATSVSSTEILVTWDSVPPIDQNGIVTMYEVLYQPLETFCGYIETRNVSGTKLAVVLMDLEEFVDYNISVRAFTSVGGGPYSDEVAATTFEDGKNFFQKLTAMYTHVRIVFVFSSF